ncbi:MAG: glycosyltransferase [Elainella sp. Prado103]|jgi:cellulose synthase/poly-beta-1,6-N-acetylglucosamine synthase-like glycosyltransferase|nr:glycosyltransferase [Elainella sp. Prado103]
MSNLKSLDRFSLSDPLLPSLSVIIPIYNGEADLPELIATLQQQDYPSDRVEFLLVDNHSQDGTATQLRAISRQDQRFHSLSETQIQSSYAARNCGIRAAKGEILVFTDADCRPQPQWLQAIVHPFLDPVQSATLGIVAGEIAALPGHSLLERYAERRDILSQRHTLTHPYCPYGQTANLAVRRCLFDQVGLFRPYLTTGGDADLCWRILRSGQWQWQWAEQAIVQHRHRTTLPELRSQWQRYGRSNRYLHELHGVELMPPLTRSDRLRRWGRWLLKELPLNFIKVHTLGTGISNWIDAMVETPLDLLCQQARWQGQCQAQLPDEARQIEWLLPGRFLPEVPPGFADIAFPDTAPTLPVGLTD